MSTYKQLYPQTLTDGIGLITELSRLDVPWKGPFDPTQLERAYALRSSSKTVLDTFAELPNNIRPNIIENYFKEKWKKNWNIFKLEYNPLSAYKVVESGKNTLTRDLQDAFNYGRKQEETTEDNGTVVDASERTNNNYNGIYGFNSALAVNANQQILSAEDTNTQTRDLDGSRVRQDSGTDTTAKTGTEKTDHDVTKEGNIGYSTPQKLLREEFELWRKPFFEIVFKDIDDFITIQVY